MKFEEVKTIEVYTVAEESNTIFKTAQILEELKNAMRNQKIVATFKDCNDNDYSIDYNELCKIITFLDCLSCDNITLE